MQELYLSVGSDDDITKDDVVALIEKHGNVPVDNLEKIKVGTAAPLLLVQLLILQR